ncbi:hypothetical protein ACUNDQ_00260 [Pectobacterium brasiliense]|uniref:hypothetical protein n=1 Tax=Pectobacterium brasiliense TaxID=180957 RepID=UPI0040445DDE
MDNNKFKIDFGPDDVIDMNDFVTFIRERVSEPFAESSVCHSLGFFPAKMSLEEKLSTASDIENGSIVVSSNIFISSDEMSEMFDFKNSGLSDLIKSAAIHELIGFERLAKQMRKRYAELFIEMLMAGVRKEADAKKVISEDRRKAKAGKTNRHKENAIKISRDTWALYPNASLAGLASEIYTHLRSKWNDAPVVGTIEGWLKESGLNPTVKPKNRSFKLVIKD